MGSDAEAELAELMGRYCAGEVAGFQRLYRTTAPRILTYLATLTANAALAEDLLQETFLRLHEQRGHYVRGANPVPWISTLAHACFLHRTRRLPCGQRPEPRVTALPITAPTVAFPQAEKTR